MQTARAARPDLKVNSAVFSGQKNAGNPHYVVFMRGDTPRTLWLIKLLLVDAQTSEITDKTR